MPDTIVIATRESRLALWQAEHVRDLLQQRFGAQVELLGMTTRGDQILDRALSKVGGKGLFVKELENALEDGRAHLAVHSLKDMPMELPAGFALGAVLEREDPRDAFTAYTALLDLQRMLPGDAHINYNLCAIKFRVWLQGGEITVDPEAFRREIEGLRKLGIDEPLVKRMLVNHAIVMAEAHMLRGEYAKKDERMDFILRNYRDLPLGERDHLSLAQYFASFANYDKSLHVLEPLLTGLGADEDLLFYYLNLTISDPAITARGEHARIRDIALTKNRKRFCDLFLPFGKGGVTFQLLDDPALFRTYCEHCER